MKRTIILGFLLTVVVGVLSAQQLKVYPVPASIVYGRHNDDFTVQVRTPGGEWQDLYEFDVNVDNDTRSKVSMVSFDFDKEVELKVRLNNGTLQKVKIRPDKAGITPVIQGNQFTFRLKKPQKLSVEVNGNKLNNLHVIANAMVKDAPSPNDKNVMYFGPGVHKPGDIPGDVFVIPSNTTVYIDGGALIQGKLLCNKVENVKIIGRGIIDQGVRGVEITHSRNITVEGIKIINPRHYSIYLGGSQNVTIKDVTAFSLGSWTDGIDMMSCSDVTIDDVFLRTSDDCIAIYAHRWSFFGNTTNVRVSNAILWADIAHPVNIGVHGNVQEEGDTISNLTFRNIDILEHDEDDRSAQGTMAITSGDKNYISNILFEEVRIDEIEEGQLFSLKVVLDPKYGNGAGRSIEHVTFKNIFYKGTLPNPSVVTGYDAQRKIRNILLKNFNINGKIMLNPEQANMKVGPYTEGLRFER
ncbi:right-handed parallel beta-helix repeat-containing protein [Niabella sp. CC-SYL272]|uniref:glycosyl hydrolase family 28 protein n=1 Tax=Niabella agricola TaxID=2891571 RepID=UPI001F21147D|nr:glycosyl hydrolase family 28 protein [Niabella agricola]MCF3108296.1 right-handed parallel beta-helix repeat-containing protein [Niabella agricola]